MRLFLHSTVRSVRNTVNTRAADRPFFASAMLMAVFSLAACDPGSLITEPGGFDDLVAAPSASVVHAGESFVTVGFDALSTTSIYEEAGFRFTASSGALSPSTVGMTVDPGASFTITAIGGATFDFEAFDAGAVAFPFPPLPVGPIAMVGTFPNGSTRGVVSVPLPSLQATLTTTRGQKWAAAAS